MIGHSSRPLASGWDDLDLDKLISALRKEKEITEMMGRSWKGNQRDSSVGKDLLLNFPEFQVSGPPLWREPTLTSYPLTSNCVRMLISICLLERTLLLNSLSIRTWMNKIL